MQPLARPRGACLGWRGCMRAGCNTHAPTPTRGNGAFVQPWCMRAAAPVGVHAASPQALLLLNQSRPAQSTSSCHPARPLPLPFLSSAAAGTTQPPVGRDGDGELDWSHVRMGIDPAPTMFVAHWTTETGEWSGGELLPYGPLHLMPAAQARRGRMGDSSGQPGSCVIASRGS